MWRISESLLPKSWVYCYLYLFKHPAGIFLQTLVAIAPSPTADDIPVSAPNLTSPETKTPGTLASGIYGCRSNFQLV